MNETQKASGTVWAVFGHRLAIEGEDGRFLADLGPKGFESITIAAGDTVSIEGERKVSEIKLSSITLNSGTVHEIAWPKKPHDDKAGHQVADPAAALATVKAQGYAVEGDLKRKPKHFEMIGSKDEVRYELHVEFDGTIRKSISLAV